METNVMKALTLNPIGCVKASDQSGKYEVHIFTEYREALKLVDQFSHVMVIWWAHHHDNPQDRGILSTELPYARGTQAGVFACRSEYRPNPIGITIMPILSLDEKNGILTLPWIDALDGTPVLDLKPYIPSSDRIRDVSVASWCKEWPLWMEEAGEYFAAHATDFGC
jgi:tRNA (adenine37-N6)-methyltransferase